jgi:hypothetical protein
MRGDYAGAMRDFDAAIRRFADDDIAGQKHTQLVLEFQRFVGEARIARAEYAVPGHVRTDLRLHGRLHVDIGEHAEPFRLELLDDLVTAASNGSLIVRACSNSW